MNRRGQAAIEFLVLFGFMLLVFTVFFVIIEQRAAQREEEGHVAELAAIAVAVREEVSLASRVHDGYNRTFTLPAGVRRGGYAISLDPAIDPTEVTVDDGETRYVVFLPVNVTTGSQVVPGYNQISKESGRVRISPASPSSSSCNADADCDDAQSCTSDRCVAHACGHSPLSGGSCDDGDGLSCTGVCMDGVCAAQDTCPVGQYCDSGTGSCQAAALCGAGQTPDRWFAGPGATAGTSWSPAAGALSRDTLASVSDGTCCDNATQCMSNPSPGVYSCSAIGVQPSAQYACENTGLGAEFFLCDATHDGQLLRNASVNRLYCCSKNAPAGSYAFNTSLLAAKGESLAVSLSCSDGSDNDCDGLRDAFDNGCWNLIINSTCGGNTAFENLTVYPNITMPGTTRYAYDWRVGGVSVATASYDFDVNNSAGMLMTRDHSQNGNNGSIGGNFASNDGFETSGGAATDAASWTEAATATRSIDNSHMGSWSMKYTVPTAAASSRQALTLNASTTYVLHGWIYNNMSDTSVNTRAYLDMRDAPWECSALSAQHNAWEYVSCEFTTNSTTSNVFVRLVVDGATIAANVGNAWFDDVGVSVKGPSWTLGGGHASSGAYVFDGVDDFISLGDVPGAFNPMTVSAWILPSNPARGAQRIVIKDPAGANGWALSLSDGGTGTLRFFTRELSVVSLDTPAVISAGQWYHVVAVWNGTGKQIWVNGVKQAQQMASGSLVDTTAPISIGAYAGGRFDPGTVNFSGTIDDVAIYGRALSAQQILALFLNQTNRTVAQELTAGDTWSACVTPNNGTVVGATTCSASTMITAGSSACASTPVPDNVTIAGSCGGIGSYYTGQDLLANATGENFTAIGTNLTYDWRTDEAGTPGILTSIAILHLTFDSSDNHTKDYTRTPHVISEAASPRSPVWGSASGRLGTGGYTFDSTVSGSEDYLQTNSAELRALNGFTLTAWIKPTAAATTGGGMIFWEGESTGHGCGAVSNQEMHLSVGGCGAATGKLSFFLGSAPYTNAGTLYADIPYTDTSAWHHVAARVSGLGGTPNLDLYLDGNPVASDTGLVASTNRASWNTALRIGSPGASGTGWFFGGGIDDARIYDRPLTDRQIQQIYRDHLYNITDYFANYNFSVCVTADNAGSDIKTLCSPSIKTWTRTVEPLC